MSYDIVKMSVLHRYISLVITFEFRIQFLYLQNERLKDLQIIATTSGIILFDMVFHTIINMRFTRRIHMRKR